MGGEGSQQRLTSQLLADLTDFGSFWLILAVIFAIELTGLTCAGVFVCLVTKGSPAALGGLRFGDQILQVNGENLAGFSSDKVHDLLKKAGVNNITMAVRDRPFERTLTLHKDSSGHIGFQFKDGKITSIVVDSSAARNGLLIDHQLLEVNGQNVVGVKDKEVGVAIEEAGDVITITIIPTYIYNIITKNMSSSLVKKLMDHSIPEM